MKCKQRLCQRNKNLKESGYCYVCDDLFNTLKKQFDANESRRNIQRVELDYDLLQETQRRLVTGVKVDGDLVNTLLLGGITNILWQSETVDKLTEKAQNLEMESLTCGTRIESLENWAKQMSEKLDKVERDKMSTNSSTDFEESVRADIDLLKRKFSMLNISSQRSVDGKETSELSKGRKSCKQCDETFSLTSDLEKHMVTFHGASKSYSCEICTKSFYLKWRLKKHLQVHKDGVKPCKYNKNGEICPYDEVGCKFKHEDNSRVGEDHCQSRGDFRIIENVIDANVNDEKTIDEVETDVTNWKDLCDKTSEEAECEVDEYVCICNYCGNWFGSQESLLLHLREKHLTPSYSNMRCDSSYSNSV